MSTKNLARTVIEGGRAHHNRRDRRNSNGPVRANERDVSRHLLLSADLDDVVYPRRVTVERWFHDKLAPAERWLGSQVGRPWNKVRSELFARFDTRTTAGRHILFDHLLSSVSNGRLPESRADDFSVDRHGILRRIVRKRVRQPWKWHLPEPRSVLADWIAGRRIGERGERAYWFVATESGAFRQHHALSEADAARWRSLPAWFREEHDAFTARPTPPTP
jgi:hypothetical protein